MFGISHTFQRFHIGKIRVIHNNTNPLCRVDRRTTTQSYDKVCTGSLIGSHTILHISNGRVSLYITIKFIRNMIVIKYFNDFGCNTKFDKVFICYEKGFLKATSGCFHSNYTPASCTEIRGLIQNNAIHSCVIILKLPQHSPSIENAAVAKVDKFSD